MANLRIDLGDGKVKELDFYNFTKYILGYSKLDEVHRRWCEEANTFHKRKLFLKPRGTYKSTVYTVAYCLWKLVQNPNERILICNATELNAQAFLREINAHLIRNDKFIQLFGKLVDDRYAKVSSTTINNRTVFSKEPSVSTVGVLGSLVSAHYSTILADDICNDKDRESDTIREKKKKWVQDLMSVLDPDGEIVVVGTVWHYDDVYAFIEKKLDPQLKPEEKWFIRKESCYEEDETTARFPTILPEDVLDRLKIEKGPLEFSSQYINKALPTESQIFFESDFQTFEYLGTNRVLDNGVVKNVEFVGYCDLSIGKSKSSDFTGLVTLGKGKDGVVYIVDVVLTRMPPDRTMETIFNKHKIFNYMKYGIESNVFQSLFSDQIKKYSASSQSYLPVIEVGHSSNKQLRIQSLQPIIKQGLLKIRDDWKDDRDYKELMSQFVYFPLAGHDDGPDAVEGAFSLIKKSGNWKGMPYFASSKEEINISGFSGELDMNKFEFNLNDNLEKMQFPDSQLLPGGNQPW